VGITFTEFYELFNKLDWSDISQNQIIPSIQRLLITLIWMRQYCTFKFLAWIFHCDHTTIGRIVNQILDKLWTITQSTITIPSLSTRISTSKRVWKYLVVMITDGTEQQIYQSTKKQQANITFSGKKKKHTFTKLLFVSPTGKIWFLSQSYPGSITDINLSEFPENFLNNKLTEDEWIIGDRGFNKLEWIQILSYSGFVNGPYAKEFLQIRCVVENTIAAVKKWKICSLPFRKTLVCMDKTAQFHHKIWTICCGLYNMYHKSLR
jgi:hypothetical protein